MAKNPRKRTPAPVLALGAITPPPDEEKAAERTESALTDVPAAPSPADIIRDEYCIASDCANVPQILRAILCEMVRGRA